MACLRDWRESGGLDITLILGVPDLGMQRGPVLVIAFKPGADRMAIVRKAQSLLESPALESVGRARWIDRSTGTDLLLIGGEASLQRYMRLYGRKQAPPRDDFSSALIAAGARADGVGQANLVLSAGPDVRRVLRELWPPEAAATTGLTGELLGDGLRSATLSLLLANTPKVTLDLTAADEASAEKLQRFVQLAVQLASAELAKNGESWATVSRAIASSLEPRREGNHVSISLSRDAPVVDKLLSEIVPTTAARISESAFRNHRMNQMKQLGLAMHIYHDRHDHFPAASAIRDAEGKPLLSWRVALLPYLEASELYNKFRLDEPWDSPHNLPLLKEMPKVFADPAARRLASGGLTTYQVPVGPATLFAPANQTATLERKRLFFGEGFTYKQVTDGTSATLMLTEVAGEHAVPWTKPADWEVDPAKPLAALRQPGRAIAVGAWADGSARAFRTDMDEQEFAKVLTKGGEEITDSDKW